MAALSREQLEAIAVAAVGTCDRFMHSGGLTMVDRLYGAIDHLGRTLSAAGVPLAPIVPGE